MTFPLSQKRTPSRATPEQKLFAYLDEALGAGAKNAPDDFDNEQAVLEAAVDLVSEQDALTCGCGVGPLISDIQQWVTQFMAGQRCDRFAEPFCLQVKFNPLAQGFVLARDERELRAHFPNPLCLPKGFPVFARKEATPLDQDVLSYLLCAEMALLP